METNGISRPYPGQLWRKVKSDRTVQVSGHDQFYVYMYWEDTDQQTVVRTRRLARASEWQPESS